MIRSTKYATGCFTDTNRHKIRQTVRSYNLTRYPEQMREDVKNCDLQQKARAFWSKVRDLRHKLIQYLLQQNRFETGEGERFERYENVRRNVGGMQLLADLCLDMRIDPLVLKWGVNDY